ncbi:MAG: hypothetical protein AAF682_06340 [Planctomycetota bacterium]
MSLRNRSSLLPLVLLALPATARADLALSKSGGALPGLTELSVAGDAGSPYLILGALSEATTVAPSGATLDVPLDLLSLSFTLPGFFGVLDGAGAASGFVDLPDLPTLAGITLSFQAVSGPAFDEVSNLVRVTPQAPGTFAETLGAPPLPVAGGAIAAQPDGRLQLVGGSGPLAQVYDPDLEEFELGGLTFGVGLLSQSTALADGRVLFSGGLGLDGQPTSAAAVYDPADGSTVELDMQLPRAGHAAALLGDGRVLITGGFAALDFTDILALLSGVQASAELFDPATMTFADGPTMLEPRALHTATPLADGGVLVAGGLTLIPLVGIPIVSATAYEFGGGGFGLPKFFSGPRLAHSAVLLEDGRVLLCGGLSVDFGEFFTTLDPLELTVGTLDDCQVYTPGFFGGFSTEGGLSTGRAGAGMAALPGGGALIAGGFELVLDLGDLLASTASLHADADVFDGSDLAPTGELGAPRLLPLLQPLDDGTVLVVGGGPLEAEVYQP